MAGAPYAVGQVVTGIDNLFSKQTGEDGDLLIGAQGGVGTGHQIGRQQSVRYFYKVYQLAFPFQLRRAVRRRGSRCGLFVEPALAARQSIGGCRVRRAGFLQNIGQIGEIGVQVHARLPGVFPQVRLHFEQGFRRYLRGESRGETGMVEQRLASLPGALR